MLYFSWADIGTIGEASATVPVVIFKSVGMVCPADKLGTWHTFHESGNALLMLERLRLFNQVDLILKNYDML